MFQLENYRGPSSRYTCPNCGEKQQFVRYVDDGGNYLAQDVGRCNRESKCGYHRPPRQYFYENPDFRARSKWKIVDKECSRPAHRKPDSIDSKFLITTLANYETNAFIQFLKTLFLHDTTAIEIAIKDYLIGTFDDYTVFPKIDRNRVIRSAKLIKYDPRTGKRRKGEYSISSLQAKLKQQGKLKEDFETDKEVFFGEHLLQKYPFLPIAIVEAEKTAVIASMSNDVFPQMIWLASSSKHWLKAHRLRNIGMNRTMILYPDADGFDKWAQVAAEGRKFGLSIKVSNLIENLSTGAEKADGFDIADYLIREQITRKDLAQGLVGLPNVAW